MLNLRPRQGFFFRSLPHGRCESFSVVGGVGVVIGVGVVGVVGYV